MARRNCVPTHAFCTAHPSAQLEGGPRLKYTARAHEQEILLPPLTGLEVRQNAVETTDDGEEFMVFDMQASRSYLWCAVWGLYGGIKEGKLWAREAPARGSPA